MNPYVTLYESTYSKEACEQIIEKFENSSSLWEDEQHTYDDGWHMHFTQIKLAKHESFSKENEELHNLFLQGISAYKKEHAIKDIQWPSKFKLEPLRMKRYLPNTDERFDEHVEVTNLETARRFLVAFIYLNDNFEGGETDFTQLKMRVKPKQGMMILFPATWNWLHKAYAVKGLNSKYIVGTLLHYV